MQVIMVRFSLVTESAIAVEGRFADCKKCLSECSIAIPSTVGRVDAAVRWHIARGGGLEWEGMLSLPSFLQRITMRP